MSEDNKELLRLMEIRDILSYHDFNQSANLLNTITVFMRAPNSRNLFKYSGFRSDFIQLMREYVDEGKIRALFCVLLGRFQVDLTQLLEEKIIDEKDIDIIIENYDKLEDFCVNIWEAKVKLKLSSIP